MPTSGSISLFVGLAMLVYASLLFAGVHNLRLPFGLSSTRLIPYGLALTCMSTFAALIYTGYVPQLGSALTTGVCYYLVCPLSLVVVVELVIILLEYTHFCLLDRARIFGSLSAALLLALGLFSPASVTPQTGFVIGLCLMTVVLYLKRVGLPHRSVVHAVTA